jgi:acetyl-CoA carboxylase carboxyl transferase subunit alpha
VPVEVAPGVFTLEHRVVEGKNAVIFGARGALAIDCGTDPDEGRASLARARVPIIASIIGEGGSGGALALGVANRVVVLEFGCYSVISPEGCAAILWKNGNRAEEAARCLKMTAPELLELPVVDEVVEEPPGGAHQDHDEMARRLEETIAKHLAELDQLSPEGLADDRYKKFRALGAFAG